MNNKLHDGTDKHQNSRYYIYIYIYIYTYILYIVYIYIHIHIHNIYVYTYIQCIDFEINQCLGLMFL